MDVASERAAIMAWLDGGPMAMLFAATYPATEGCTTSKECRAHGGFSRSRAPGWRPVVKHGRVRSGGEYGQWRDDQASRPGGYGRRLIVVERR